MKKFNLRIMACLMIAAMICTCMGTTKASAAEGDFSGKYPGDYQAEWIEASAFEGCENGAVVSFTCKKDDAWANTYWQYTFIDSAWAKLLDESLYTADGRPSFNPYEFVDVADADTATFSPEGVKAIIASGKLGIQCAGIVPLNWTVTPVAGAVAEEPEAPVVDEPVAEEPAEEPEAPVVDEPVAEEPAEEPEAPVVDEPVVEEPAEAPVADKTGDAVVLVAIVALAAACALVFNRKRVNA